MAQPILPDSIDSMFPKKQLSFKDFELGELQYGTITNVYLKVARVRPQRWGNQQQQRPDPDVDPEWMLELREFQLPLPLRVNRARTVAIALGTDNPREWIGRKICFYRAKKVAGGSTIEGLFIDDRPVFPVQEQRIGPVTKYADDTRDLPPGFMDRFIAHMAQFGKKWDDFLMWTKRSDVTAFANLYGIPLEDVRFGAKDVMAAYLLHLRTPAPAPTPAPTPATAPPAALPAPSPKVVFQSPAGQSVVGTPTPTPARSFNFDPSRAPGGTQGPRTGPTPIDDSDIPF